MAKKGKSTKARWADPDDAPTLTGHELSLPDSNWQIGGRAVSASEGKAAFRAALVRKTRINIHVDDDVLAYYRHLAGDRGYQTLINKALRRNMQAEAIDQTSTALKNDLAQIKNEISELRNEIREIRVQYQAVRTQVSIEQF